LAVDYAAGGLGEFAAALPGMVGGTKSPIKMLGGNGQLTAATATGLRDRVTSDYYLERAANGRGELRIGKTP